MYKYNKNKYQNNYTILHDLLKEIKQVSITDFVKYICLESVFLDSD